jgi:hypothetical protein
MAALEAEPAQAASRSTFDSRVMRRLRPVAGLAVAASVAAVAVLTIQRNDAPTPAALVASQTEAATAPLAASAPELSYTVPSTTSRSAFVPATRLTNYVVAHSEYSSPLGRRSVLSGVLSEDEVEMTPTDSSVIETRVTHP